MRVAFDTSVLVAGLLENHRHHYRAIVWLRAVADETFEGFFSRHALAETWSVLTRIPLEPRLSGAEASQILERLQREGFTATALPGEVYDIALRRRLAVEGSPKILAPPDPPSLELERPSS